MKGEVISIETARITADIEKENKKLQEENENLKDYLKIMEKGKDNNLNRFLDYKSRNEKAIEYIKNKIEYLNEQKRLIANILTPQNGYLKADIEIEISKYQEILKILEGGNKE